MDLFLPLNSFTKFLYESKGKWPMHRTDEFISAVKKYSNIMIIIPGSPDPDAIASAFALQQLLSSISVNSDIIITKKISLSQNRVFVKYTGINLIYRRKPAPLNYAAYIVPDFQTNIIEGITGHIPCAAHIDHHTITHNVAESDFSLIRTDSGSTSSLVALMLKELRPLFSVKDTGSVSTALMFGIQTDTDKYEHVTHLDIEALNFLSDHADREMINKLNGIPMSPVTMDCYARASANQHIYKDWGIYGIGYIGVEHRDSIAITADLLLKRPGSGTVIVFALVEDRKKEELYLDASFRTRLDTLDINAIIKKITIVGGGRQFKGAYQVNLDYFHHCPDRDQLWRVVETTTLHKLKKARDDVYKQKAEVLLLSAFKKISSILKNK